MDNAVQLPQWWSGPKKLLKARYLLLSFYSEFLLWVFTSDIYNLRHILWHVCPKIYHLLDPIIVSLWVSPVSPGKHLPHDSSDSCIKVFYFPASYLGLNIKTFDALNSVLSTFLILVLCIFLWQLWLPVFFLCFTQISWLNECIPMEQLHQKKRYRNISILTTSVLAFRILLYPGVLKLRVHICHCLFLCCHRQDTQWL